MVAARDALIDGIQTDLQAIADGAPLPALGEWGVVILAMGLSFWAFQRFPIGRKQLSKQE